MRVLKHARIFQHMANFSRIDCSTRSSLFVCFRVNLYEAPRFQGTNLTCVKLCALKDSAPLKLPTRYCLPRFLPLGLEHTTTKNAISLATPCYPKAHFKVSRLCYALQSYAQYQAVVKLLGSFRLTAGTRHLHRDCIFTELSSETVAQTLHYSTRQNLPDKELRSTIPQSWTLSSSVFRNKSVDLDARGWSLINRDWTDETLLSTSGSYLCN